MAKGSKIASRPLSCRLSRRGLSGDGCDLCRVDRKGPRSTTRAAKEKGHPRQMPFVCPGCLPATTPLACASATPLPVPTHPSLRTGRRWRARAPPRKDFARLPEEHRRSGRRPLKPEGHARGDERLRSASHGKRQTYGKERRFAPLVATTMNPATPPVALCMSSLPSIALTQRSPPLIEAALR